MDNKKLIKNVIQYFDTESLINFFRSKTNLFSPVKENLSHYDDTDFKQFYKIGEIKFETSDDRLIIVTANVRKNLTERSGKKAQYEKAKKILKESNSDAGIFIFYDDTKNFRFSLVYEQPIGTRRIYNNFRRFTYFVSPELTNKTFLSQIGDGEFSSLDKIKDAFSVEKVTKEFYREIANWYFWAVKNVVFPNDAESEKNGRNIAAIRMITRLIFIWFMKQKGLVTNDLFNQSYLKTILKDWSGSVTTYYRAILQNLFFATLNTPIKERKFRCPERYHGVNKDFMDSTYYRYEDYFIDSDKMIDLFKNIPFLNGGLFECLDKIIEENTEQKQYLRIDGFSDREDNILTVPNYLFFSEEKNVDLNKDYGTKNKKYLFRGIIDILQSYNFTIDENTPVDEEVALDPELLGRVFENLLASYNPETETTARKSTGSYYTPREIVNYMVDQSLKEYLKTKLTENNKSNVVADLSAKTKQSNSSCHSELVSESELNILLSYENDTNPFNEQETEILISAINNCKIIDPAVGSGAFPMGILQKLVLVLSKLDPHNIKWEQQQIDGVEKNVTDISLKKDLITKIEQNFAKNELDYGRKLYLIQNCIYGVDIQPIAIHIAKLRFFISLLVDEKKNNDINDNFGIEPLPNLETKFVAANSLIGLETKEGVQQLLLKDPLVGELENELIKIRTAYFNTTHTKEKNKLREKDKEIRKKLVPLLKRETLTPDSTKKFVAWDPYNSNLSADWFDPEWMFGIKSGFDIVIANPPYVRQEDIKDQKPALQKAGYEVYNSTSDLYTYFYEKSYQILKPAGGTCFISSNKWMRAKYGEKLRKFFKDKTTIKKIIDFNGYQVFDATVDTNIILFQKIKPTDNTVNILNIRPDFTKDTDISNYFKNHNLKMKQSVLDTNCFTFGNETVMNLKTKIEKVGTPLKDWDIKIYRGIITGFNEAFIIDTATKEKLCRDDPKSSEILKPILRGRDISKYSYKWADLWLIKIESGWTNKNRKSENAEKYFEKCYPAVYRYLTSFKKSTGKGKGLVKRDDQGDYWWELRDCDYYPEFEKEKIVWQEIVREPSFAYDDTGIYCEATSFIMTGKNLKYILGLLNSKPVAFFFKEFYAGGGLGDEGYRYKKAFLEQLPIPKISESDQKPFIEIVDKILAIKAKNPESNTSVLEHQIDQLVYKLYGLTPDEIRIIEDL